MYSTQFISDLNRNNETPVVITGLFRSQQCLVTLGSFQPTTMSGSRCERLAALMWSKGAAEKRSASGNAIQEGAQRASARRKCVCRKPSMFNVTSAGNTHDCIIFILLLKGTGEKVRNTQVVLYTQPSCHSKCFHVLFVHKIWHFCFCIHFSQVKITVR